MNKVSLQTLKVWDNLKECVLVVLYLILMISLILPSSLEAQSKKKEDAVKYDPMVNALLKLEARRAHLAYSGRKMVINLARSIPHVTFFSIREGLQGQARTEYLSPSSSLIQVVIDDGYNIWNYNPLQSMVVKHTSSGSSKGFQMLQSDLQKAVQNYSIVRMEDQVVAGSQAEVYRFIPKKEDRPARQFWIGRKSGIPLRTETYDVNKKLSLVAAFMEVDMAPQIDEKSFCLKVPKHTKLCIIDEQPALTFEEAQLISGLPLKQPKYLPEGFSLNGIFASDFGNYKQVHFQYTDGLSSLSVFQRQSLPSDQTFSQISKKIHLPSGEGYSAYLQDFGLIRIVNFQEDLTNLTVVGEVTEEEMIRIADSLVTPGKD